MSTSNSNRAAAAPVVPVAPELAAIDLPVAFTDDDAAEMEVRPNRRERRSEAKARRLGEPVAMLTIDQTAHELNISRAHVYNLIAKRKIKSVKLGRCRRVPAAEVKRLAASL